jgi:hypothetical protein
VTKVTDDEIGGENNIFGFDVGDFGDIVREYSKIGDWKSGWAIFETHQVFGESFGNPSVRHCVGLVPLDGLLEYLADVDVVTARIQDASAQLVQRWNALEVKKPLEWKDEIARFDWIGRQGKPETSIFEFRLSTYGFTVINEKNSAAVLHLSDVKVCCIAPPLV